MAEPLPIIFANLPVGLNPLALLDEQFAAATNGAFIEDNTIPLSALLTGASGLAVGVAAFLGTPSSANLAAAVTDETGTDALVFANSPVLVAPNLGTPSAAVLTNATGTAAGLTAGAANGLKSATTTVAVSAATAPTAGQVLTATSSTAANWASPTGGLTPVANRTALSTLSTAVGVAWLEETGRQGPFQWNSSNLSTQVTADPQQGVYVPPTSDPTGASGAWVRQFNGGLSQYWFGAVANGSTDDTTAIKAALSFSAFSGVPCKFAAGESLISSTITISTSCDLSAAEFVTDGSLSVYNSYPFTPVVVGSTASGGVVGPINVLLPNIVNTTHTVGDGWTNTTNSIGVALINLDYSNVTVNNVFGFGNGVGIGGFGEGTSYVTVTLGSVISNKNGVIFQAFNTTGWANQNTVIGGKIGYDTGETTPGTRNLSFFLASGSTFNPDGNTVVGTSLEGNSAVSVEFASAVDNTLVGVRFETTSPLAVNTGASLGNMIIGGYKPNLTFSNTGTFSTLMLDQNGQYLPGPVVLGSPGVTTNPQILTGTGVPATTLGTIGSLYLNLSGGTSTTLYVKTAASTWTPK